jgi:hypothetical protein
MLTIERIVVQEGARYQVGLKLEDLRAFLQGIAPSFVRYLQNARFTFNDETHKLDLIQHAVIGRELDIEASLKAIDQKATAGEHSLPLVLKYTFTVRLQGVLVILKLPPPASMVCWYPQVRPFRWLKPWATSAWITATQKR